MVLLDSSSPEQLTQHPELRRAVRPEAPRPEPSPATLARLGLSRVFAASPQLPGAGRRPGSSHDLDPVRPQERTRRRVHRFPEVFEQAQALTTLNGRPLTVLTASETLHTTGWAAAQDKLAALSTNRVHRDVDSSHAGLVEDQHGSTESVHAITEVLTAVRTGLPLATP